MEHIFWHNRWEQNRIGFHLPNHNKSLVAHCHHILEYGSKNIFVPLCGKSNDLIFLHQQGSHVIANELSLLAVDAFFAENQISFELETLSINPVCVFKHYQANKLSVYAGDFFCLQAHYLNSVAAVYDRAALVSLPEKMRIAYVAKLLSILPAGVKILLVAWEYDQNLNHGPPFSVTEKEVHELYGDHFSIEILEQQSASLKTPQSTNSLKISLLEKVYLLKS